MLRDMKKEQAAFDKAMKHFNHDANHFVHAINSELKKNKLNMLSQQAIMHWRKGGIPSNRARIIETVTNGAVTREQLRPDLYS